MPKQKIKASKKIDYWGFPIDIKYEIFDGEFHF